MFPAAAGELVELVELAVDGIDDDAVAVPVEVGLAALDVLERELLVAALDRSSRGGWSIHPVLRHCRVAASVGCLHIRPLINTKDRREIQVMKDMTDEIADLVMEFGGAGSRAI